jgi:two-component system chemotaxis sensor kinase CheA
MNEDHQNPCRVRRQFLQEAGRRLEEIEAGLLNIESGQEIDEQVRLIFRGFHGLKGVASFVEEREIIEIANAGETLLSQVRDYGRKFEREWVDLLLQCHDDLKRLLHKTLLSSIDRGSYLNRLQELNRVIEQNRQGPTTVEQDSDFTHELEGHVKGLNMYLEKLKPGAPDEALIKALARKLRLIDRAANSRGRNDVSAVVALYSKELENRDRRHWTDLQIASFSRITDDLLKNAHRAPSAPRRSQSPQAGAAHPRISHRLEIRPDYLEGLEALVTDFSIYADRLSEDLSRMGDMLRPRARPWLRGLEYDLKQFATALRQSCKRLRLTPVSRILDRFPRLARDIAKRDKKRVKLKITGGDTELPMDKVERLAEPLAHLIRNAVDHGVETPGERSTSGKPEEGSVSIEVAPDQDHVVIKVSDDGQGIDFDKIKSKAVSMGLNQEKLQLLEHTELFELIFLNGLTTQENANTISGRGVGMDIVKESVSELNGSIKINSTPGVGTEFIITIPLTPEGCPLQDNHES